MMIRNDHADHQFEWLRKEAGVLRFDSARYQPRLHDFRHTFAVTSLLTWYRQGKDARRRIQILPDSRRAEAVPNLASGSLNSPGSSGYFVAPFGAPGSLLTKGP